MERGGQISFVFNPESRQQDVTGQEPELRHPLVPLLAIQVLQETRYADGTSNTATVTIGIDADQDGVAHGADNCPGVANADQIDTDGDGEGDACDADDDGDGTADVNDAFPLNPSETADSDGDGMGDNFETKFGLNPADPADAALDADSDGLTNLEEFQRDRNPLFNEASAVQSILPLLLDPEPEP